MVDFGTPFEIRWGQKWHQNPPSGATNLKFLALCSVCVEFFGVPNSGSTSGSIFNGIWVDLCSFFAVLGVYANRFWMILDIKIQPFWNRVRFSIPYPPERPNAKHQVSNFGICQDLPESARSLPGSARNLPRISWSTIASTHLPHIHWPRNASQVTNCQAPKRGGGGDRPLAAFNIYKYDYKK